MIVKERVVLLEEFNSEEVIIIFLLKLALGVKAKVKLLVECVEYAEDK
jgi:hypothetical protein